jgi:hypothetical protein
VSAGSHAGSVALLYGMAFGLILVAAVSLGIGLVSDAGFGSAVVALVSSAGGLLLLALGVFRRSGSPPVAD